MYGHGDVVDGMTGDGGTILDPWRTTTIGNRVYGAAPPTIKDSTASIVGAPRVRGRAVAGSVSMPNSSLKPGEEIGSPDLRQVCEQLRDELKADLFFGSDGPRLSADRPTIFLGCRGGIRIHLDVNLRDGSHHSGNWGGVLANPATILASAIATLVDGNGRLLLDALKPPRISNQIVRSLPT
jgi:acetylornithine deacetylase/succinyl-diaminopimelate desuccinylase-like protein